MDGDIPPSMSPLDAFAAQSRLLAKKLDDSSRNGRRVSRLPPLTTAYSLKSTQPPGYLRSRSSETEDATKDSKLSPKVEESGNVPEVAEPSFRPKSFYPRMSGVLLDNEDTDRGQDDEPFVTPAEFGIQSDHGPSINSYFDAPRAQSPIPIATQGFNYNAQINPVSQQREKNAADARESQQREFSSDTSSVKSQKVSGLVPPQSPQVRQAGSVRSIPVDSSDDELSASTNGSSFSLHRKQSSSSGVSLPRSPLSPFGQVHGRSPSLNSEYSLGGSRLARPTYNFSRPISRGSMGRPSLETTSRQPSFDIRPSFDSNSRQPSSDSQPFIFTDETVQTPVSIYNEHIMDAKSNPAAPAPSYIYAKFSLPRGRILQRDSGPLDILPIPALEGEKSVHQSNANPVTPPTSDHNGCTSPAMSRIQSPKPGRGFSRSPPRSSDEQNRPIIHRPPATPLGQDSESQSSASMRSGSTIKARSYNSRAMTESRELTAEDHLAKGIESHERGNFKESTYHLRIAAKHNLPTAMLLYALACRHGWGMRPNQHEGVQWLRKAADCASLDLADEETQSKDGKLADAVERKTRRAQFALSIYELGVSHMNGWGIEQDKALALRCFEIAGNWGDADAMAEAGFCYAQGSGCKKDLKKAAKYYRMAEAKGMSMVGNSW